MKYKIAILFNSAPFGQSRSREGLDALLAASAFCEEDALAFFFFGDGVFNLRPAQNPSAILQKDHISMLKLLDLYGLEKGFVHTASLQRAQLDPNALQLTQLTPLDDEAFFKELAQAEKVLTF